MPLPWVGYSPICSIIWVVPSLLLCLWPFLRLLLVKNIFIYIEPGGQLILTGIYWAGMDTFHTSLGRIYIGLRQYQQDGGLQWCCLKRNHPSLFYIYLCRKSYPLPCWNNWTTRSYEAACIRVIWFQGNSTVSIWHFCKLII